MWDERERGFLDLHLESMGRLRGPWHSSERQRGIQNGDLRHSVLDLRHLRLTSGPVLLSAQHLIILEKTVHFSKRIQAP